MGEKVIDFEKFLAEYSGRKSSLEKAISETEKKLALLQAEVETAQALGINDRITTAEETLTQVKAEFDALVEQHKALDPAPLAAAAMEEIDGEIVECWREFSQAIEAITPARRTFLEAVAHAGSVMNKGNGLIERGQRLHLYSGEARLKNAAKLQTHVYPFEASLDVLKRAFFRGQV